MATELPAPVARALEELRKKHKHRVTIARINDNYYTYEETTRFSEEKGKKVPFTLYLGKIESDGKFVEARHRKKETATSSVEESIKRKLEGEDALGKLIHPDDIDLQIIEAISTDGRIPVNEIAKNIGISGVATRYRLDKLEKRYNIKYTIELGPRPYGFFRYVVFVRFLKDKPPVSDMKRVLEKEPTIQMVALLKGSYDLFIYMFAENTQLLEDKIYEIRSSATFANYDAYWQVSYITYGYGYVPIRDEFFELLKNKVWHRSRETPRRKPGELLEREYLVLKEMHQNGRKSFIDIDQKLGLNNGASQYTYYQLIDSRLIERITINMERLPIKHISILRCTQTNIQKFNSNRDIVRLDSIENTKTPINRYLLWGDIGTPYGLLYITALLDEKISDAEERLTKLLKGTKIKSYVIIETIIGSLGYRKIERESTYQYERLTGGSQKDI